MDRQETSMEQAQMQPLRWRAPKVFAEEPCRQCTGTGYQTYMKRPRGASDGWVEDQFEFVRTESGERLLCTYCDGSGTTFAFIREPYGIGTDYMQFEASTDWEADGGE